MNFPDYYTLPNLSIIIPVLNQRDRLRRCLEALRQQDYPPEKMEIIVVDNGSTDGSLQLAKDYGGRTITYLKSKNPYPARNLGVSAANAEVIVLLDAKVIPNSNLLKSGVNKLQQSSDILVAGNVQLTFPERASWGHWLYALRIFPNRLSVIHRFGVPTTILFCQKQLFQRIGFFMEQSRGGADIEWSQRVWEIGETIGYESQAQGCYEVPGLKGVLEKIKREGISYRKISRYRQSNGLSWRWKASLWRYLLPARPFKLQNRIREDFVESKPMLGKFWRLWLLHWGSKLLLLYWIIRGED